jgi:hypothetical protein
MLCRGGFRQPSTRSTQTAAGQGATATQGDVPATHTLLRILLWLLRGQLESSTALPVRVFYKFDSGCWRSRSTLQLHKVYRCR